MKAEELYQLLEQDFITPEMSDDWFNHMNEVSDFLCENFKKRSMGLVCDFTAEINKVYTAVFPSNNVLEKILEDGVQDALLFVHHPQIWDIRNSPNVFLDMDRELLQRFKERRISIYNLHVPLDNFGEYSTSLSLAKALGLKIENAFAPYFGALCGVFGKTNLVSVQELRKQFQDTIGHEVSLYDYGDDEIKGIAVVAGGGNDIDVLTDVFNSGVNTFITGITTKNNHSKEAHDFAKKNKINILGGTHYSTEKFACISMTDYFKDLGICSEFVKDTPLMDDL